MPESRALKGLTTEAYINLATFRRNGTAVETPVWFAILGGKLYVVTDGTSAKVKRIRATQRVRFAACNVWGRVSGDWIDGR
jgi:PPOX class probable F420-dependent enzyme